MSNPNFNAQIILSSSTPTPDDQSGSQFIMKFSVQDFTGASSGLTANAGDYIFLDTSGLVLGTISRYIIVSFISQSHDEIEAIVAFHDSGSVIDPGGSVGVPGLISSSTTLLHLNLVEAGIQQLPESFLTYLENSNMEVLDEQVGSLVSAQYVYLKFNFGDSILNLCMIGNAIDVANVEAAFDGDNTVTISNVKGTAHLVSANFALAPNVNTTATFSFVYPEKSGQLTLAETYFPIFILYNLSGIVQPLTETAISISNDNGIVTCMKSRLTVSAGYFFRINF